MGSQPTATSSTHLRLVQLQFDLLHATVGLHPLLLQPRLQLGLRALQRLHTPPRTSVSNCLSMPQPIGQCDLTSLTACDSFRLARRFLISVSAAYLSLSAFTPHTSAVNVGHSSRHVRHVAMNLTPGPPSARPVRPLPRLPPSLSPSVQPHHVHRTVSAPEGFSHAMHQRRRTFFRSASRLSFSSITCGSCR